MRRLLGMIMAVLLGASLIGCSTAAREIHMKSLGERTDVFDEVKAGAEMPKGVVDLIIKSSLKTHREGFYAVESGKSLHGKNEYPFVLNVDGQAVVWEVAGMKENTDKKDRSSESGEGMRYALNKRIRLKPGMHTVFLGLPGENRHVEFTIMAAEGKVHTVEAKPVYNRHGYEGPRFEHGVARIEVFFNGNKLP